MRVHHTVLLALILMMFISDSTSKPQGIPGVSTDDKTFLCQLAGGTCVPINECADESSDPSSCSNSLQVCCIKKKSDLGCPSPSESCVLIDRCCDPEPEEGLKIDKVSGAPIIIDIINPKFESNPCSALQICCEKKCDLPVDDPPEPPHSTKAPPTPGEQCGIRNTEGFRVTLAGTDIESQYGEFPWMVAVLAQSDDGYVGGGSLVHHNVVLTAAHKVHGKEGFVARIGDWDLTGKIEEEFIAAQNINVKKVVYHPDFSRQTLVNNVALLILERDAKLGETVMPICLPDPNENFDGASCTVTGWGKNALDGGKFQKVLKKVNVPAVNHNECQRLLQNTRLGQSFTLHNSFNCAGGDGEDSCEGDGGSPLICPKPNNPNEYVQMGVVAWGIGCGIKGNPGVYGSVPKTVEWIKQIIKEEGGINERGGSTRG